MAREPRPRLRPRARGAAMWRKGTRRRRPVHGKAGWAAQIERAGIRGFAQYPDTATGRPSGSPAVPSRASAIVRRRRPRSFETVAKAQNSAGSVAAMSWVSRSRVIVGLVGRSIGPFPRRAIRSGFAQVQVRPRTESAGAGQKNPPVRMGSQRAAFPPWKEDGGGGVSCFVHKCSGSGARWQGAAPHTRSTSPAVVISPRPPPPSSQALVRPAPGDRPRDRVRGNRGAAKRAWTRVRRAFVRCGQSMRASIGPRSGPEIDQAAHRPLAG